MKLDGFVLLYKYRGYHVDDKVLHSEEGCFAVSHKVLSYLVAFDNIQLQGF